MAEGVAKVFLWEAAGRNIAENSLQPIQNSFLLLSSSTKITVERSWQNQ
jgi:hypothetical protein